MRCIYGNALQYGLSMLKWEKMYGNASGNAFKLQWCVAFWTIHVFRVRFHNLSHLLLDIGHLQILLLLMCRFKWINFYSLSDDFIFHWCLFRQTFRANLSLSFNLFFVRNCVIANGWWCFYHYSFNKKVSYLFLQALRLLKDISFLSKRQFYFCFSYGCRSLQFILPVWSHFWYFWISLSCILMQIVPLNGHI